MKTLLPIILLQFTILTQIYSQQCGTQYCPEVVSETQGTCSSRIGTKTSSPGNYAFSSGYQSTAIGISSFAIGHNCTATGNYSFSQGYESQATNLYSTAIGYRASAGSSAVAL
jgi:hypothetical protein